MPVKRALLLTAFLLATPVNAEISDDVKATCMDAKDFVGCVKALSGGVQIASDDGLNPLRNSMKQVAARLESGTSLRDSSATFQPVIDQLAIAKDQFPDALAVKAADKASGLFNILQAAWQGRISTLMSNQYGPPSYSCLPTARGIEAFNSYIGATVIKGYSVSQNKEIDLSKGGFLGANICTEATIKYNESSLYDFVIGVLKEGAVQPEMIEKYEKDRAEAMRLANMEAWQKHLEKNPGLKAWADANPKMAESDRKKYNLKNPQEKVSIPPYEATLEFLSNFNPPL